MRSKEIIGLSNKALMWMVHSTPTRGGAHCSLFPCSGKFCYPHPTPTLQTLPRAMMSPHLSSREKLGGRGQGARCRAVGSSPWWTVPGEPLFRMPRALLPLPLCRICFSENNPILTQFAQASPLGEGCRWPLEGLGFGIPPAVCAITGLLAPLCESLPF